MASERIKNQKVNVKFLQDVAETYKKSKSTTGVVDIVTFAEAKWGLNINLFPVQKFILKSFYGLELDDTEKSIIIPDEINTREIGRFTEREFMQFLIDTGRTNLKEYTIGKTRGELVLCCGRRASKSSIASIISNYEVYRLLKMGNPQKYFGFPDGQEIAVCTTATTDEQASTLFNTMKNYCLNCSFLKEHVVNKSKEFFTLATEMDIQKELNPTIYLLCGGGRSHSIRGHNNLVVIMDEAAFFPITGEGNGEEVIKALQPSVASFTHDAGDGKRVGESKSIFLSSPYGKSGVFYRKYIESFDLSESVLMFNMYTTMINPNVDSQFLKDEKRRNPAMFECEYCAKFSDTVSTWIDDDTLQKVIDKDEPTMPSQRKGKKGREYYMGIDFGGKNDGAALAVVHKENEQIVLDYADVFYGGQSDVWYERHPKQYEYANKALSGYDIIPLEDFADEVARVHQNFPIKYGWFDQFNGYALHERLRAKGLYQFEIKPFTQGLNTQMYQVCKSLICSELVRLYNHPVLIPELQTLEETKNGAHISVEAPRRTGHHDDITDAVVLAIYSCYLHTQNTTANSVIYGAQNGRIISGAKSYKSYKMGQIKNHGYNFKRLW